MKCACLGHGGIQLFGVLFLSATLVQTTEGLAATSSQDGRVAAVARTSNNMDAFWIDPSGAIKHSYWNAGSRWVTEPFLAAGSTSTNGNLTAVSRKSDHVEFFYRDASGYLSHRYWYQASGWSSFRQMHGNTYKLAASAGISAVAPTPTSMYVFFVESNTNLLCYSYWTEGSDWVTRRFYPDIKVSASGGVAALSRASGYVEVFYIHYNNTNRENRGGSIHHNYSTDGINWSGDRELTVNKTAHGSTSIAALSRSPDKMDIFYVNDKGSLRHSWWTTGTTWSGDNAITNDYTVAVTKGLSAVSRDGNLMEVFFLDQANRLSHVTYDGSTWHDAVPSVPLAGVPKAGGGVAVMSRQSDAMEVCYLGNQTGSYSLQNLHCNGDCGTGPWHYQVISGGPCDALTNGCAEAYSVTRAMTASYRGPLFQLQKISDGRTLDVMQTSSQKADLSTWSGLCGGTPSNCVISKVYAQIHNGNSAINNLLPVTWNNKLDNNWGWGPKCDDSGYPCAARFTIESATGLPILTTFESQQYALAEDGDSVGIRAGNNAMGILYNGKSIPNETYCCGLFGLTHRYDMGNIYGTDFMVVLGYGHGESWVNINCGSSTSYCVGAEEESYNDLVDIPFTENAVVVTQFDPSPKVATYLNGVRLFSRGSPWVTQQTGNPINAGRSIHLGGGGDLTQPDRVQMREALITNHFMSDLEVSAMQANSVAFYPSLSF
jgi:hypothetical protein